MNTNQILSATNSYQTAEAYKKTSDQNVADTTAKTTETADTEAYVYEKKSADTAATTNSKNKNYVTLSKENKAIVEQLKADAEQRTAQLRSLVESMILKQNKTFRVGTLTDEKMYEMLAYPFLGRQRYVLAANNIEDKGLTLLLYYFFIESRQV